MSGFCSTPGHQDEPARLYPGGWLCDQCRPGAVPSVSPAGTEGLAA